MKTSVSLLIILCLFMSPVYADILYLNEGEELTGKLLTIKNNQISFKKISGEKVNLEFSKVAHILISKIRKGDEVKNVSEIKDATALKVLKNLPDFRQFADSDHVTLFRQDTFDFSADNSMTLTTREIIKILKEPGLEKGNNSVYFFADRGDCELLYGHTYSPDGKVYHITDDAVSLESLRSGTPEYAKTKKLKIALKKVDIGSIIDFSHRRKVFGINEIRPNVISYVFGEREPVLHQECIIKFPEKLNFEKNLFQWSDKIKFSEQKTTENKVAWKWTFSDKEGFVPEQNMLPLKRIFPRFTVHRNYPWEKTAESLIEAYKGARPTPEALNKLIKKAGITDSMSDYEKTTALYETINKEIRHVGMTVSQMGSFEPVSAEVTLNKKYGNRHSRVTLMYFALKKLGIEAYPGFCSDKWEQATVEDFNNIGFSRYAILKVILDGKPFYTECMSLYRPFATISTILQGATACFLDLENSEFSFSKLPKTTHSWNRYNRNILVNLNSDGDMEVKEMVSFRGPFEAGIRELKGLRDIEKRNYAERRVKNVHPNALLKNFAFTEIDNLNAPAVLTLHYSIPGGAQKASNKIMTFKNFWVNYQSSSASLNKRKYPMKYWATEENTQTIMFELPENFDWVPWNRQYNYNSGNISFISNMNQHENQLIYSDRFIARDDEFLIDKTYQNYRSCILTMSELANQWIILEKVAEPEKQPKVSTEKLQTASESIDLNQIQKTNKAEN
ncbi:MAG: DUF3857 domain-containing protein [Candidatus Rifleibacteriota bacterium]